MKRLVLAFATLAASTALRAGDVYKIDAAHAEIGFKIRHLGLSHVTGKFDKYTGSLTLEGGKLTGGEATIEAASVNTAEAKRDEHLRKPDFFNVEKHATLTFKVTQVAEKTLTGDLTILGKTKPVTLEYTLTGPIDHPFVKGGKKVGFEATGKIDRFDFGMDWNTMPGVVGREVILQVSFEADKT